MVKFYYLNIYNLHIENILSINMVIIIMLSRRYRFALCYDFELLN